MISISLDGYQTKPSDIVPQIRYVKRDLNLNEIEAYIANGHSLSANFKHYQDGFVTQKHRNYENFSDTCFVFFDLDNDFYNSLKEVNDSLTLKPTLCYTTYSHLLKGNRYRLLYIFEEPITQIDVYQIIYNKILSFNKFPKLEDNCGCNAVQNVFGSYYTNQGYTFLNNNITYHIKDFITDESAIGKHIKKKGKSIIECDCTLKDRRELKITNDIFVSDYKSSMNIRELLDKYNGCYPLVEETPLEDVDDDTAYILYPSDYVSINRRWTFFQVLDERGNEKVLTTRVRRIKDGEGRRRKLYLNGVLRRHITKDTISFDNLLFCLLYEFENYYEHKDIDKLEIWNIALSVWNADLSKSEHLKGTKHKFRINPKFCEKYGLSKKQAMPIAIKQLNSKRIGELYDCNLTDKANLEVFKKYGIDIKIRTLKQWRKENGIVKYKKKPK